MDTHETTTSDGEETPPTAGRHGIIADGRERAIDANLNRIAAEVRARYAPEFRKAGILRRMILSVRIRLEIRRELEKVAPSDGLYAVSR